MSKQTVGCAIRHPLRPSAHRASVSADTEFSSGYVHPRPACPSSASLIDPPGLYWRSPKLRRESALVLGPPGPLVHAIVGGRAAYFARPTLGSIEHRFAPGVAQD